MPASIGLTGLPTWFWVAGYDGQALTASTRVYRAGLPNPQAGCPGGPSAEMEVAVRAIPIGYDWQFGDVAAGTMATTSLGAPYPELAGAITHEYERTSAGSGDPEGFPVTLVAHFRIQYTAGGAWQVLTQTDRQTSFAYKVQQAYPVIVRP